MGSRSIIPTQGESITIGTGIKLTKPGTLSIGNGGQLVVTLKGNTTPTTYPNLQDGSFFPYVVIKIWGSTTCSGINVHY